MKVKPNSERRHVVVDIETVTLDPADEKGALSALTGRIVCICLLIDDGTKISEASLIELDEALILERFWRIVKLSDQFIGHNLLEFDMPFIRQRSWIQQVRPSRKIDLKKYYTQDLVDTMQLWSNWGSTKHPKLDALGAALGVGQKTAHGCDVAAWWHDGDYASIAEYCREDVRLTYRVFCRLMFQAVPERYRAAVEASAAALAKGAA